MGGSRDVVARHIVRIACDNMIAHLRLIARAYNDKNEDVSLQ